MEKPLAVILIGVSGSGKTTVGQALAARINCPFLDGDDFHPPANLAKMAAGIPLDDDDRVPWLNRLHELLIIRLARGECLILACSALKRAYRRRLRGSLENIRFVYLKGSFDLIQSRMEKREGHFMKADMLRSQFKTMEEPAPGENILTVDIADPPEKIAGKIARSI